MRSPLMINRKFALVVLVLITLLSVRPVSGSVSAQTGSQPLPLPGDSSTGYPLFTPANPSQLRSLVTRPEQIGTERSTFVTLNPETLSLASASRSIGQVINDPGIVFNLFPEVMYTAVNSRIEPRSLNRPGYIWYGSIPAVPLSNVVLIVGDDGQISGQVLIPGKNYYIDAAGNGTRSGIYRISEIDTYTQRGNYQDFVNVTPSQAEMDLVHANQNSPRADDGSVIDLMVVYTPKAVTFMGSVSNMEFAIENAVALANLTYLNSNVNFQLRLVHTEQVDYVEQPFVDLEVLTDPNDGVIDNVHTLRDQYKADLVALIPGTSAEERGYCGIANLPTSLPAPTTGFSVTEALCISDITLPHELGHNMGKAHDPANAGGAVHPYAYGYQDAANPVGQDWGDFVTVMAYSTAGECPDVYQPGVCPAIAWWSNPEQTYNGKPLGTVDQNNALSLNQTALTIANYRISDDGGQSTATPSPTPTIPPTETSTPVPGETATATTAAPVELVLNGSFEIDADSDGTPDGWSASKANLRKCGDVGFSSNCAVRLKGKPGVKNKLQQTIPNVSTLSVGDTLTLSGRIKGKGVIAGGTLQLKLKYIDDSLGDNGKTTLTIPLPAGDYGYTLLNDTADVLGDVQKAQIRLRYNGDTGKITADDLSLMWLDAG